MIAKEINITHTGQILASFIIGLCLCLWTALNMKPSIGVAIGFIPFATLFIFICINRPVILLAITFMLNYLIMGINRYHSIPIAITNIFDLLYGIMLALILLKQLQSNHHFRKILNVYTCITLVWLLYCIINIGNGITGEFYMEAWLRILRPWALYPILTCIILSIHCNRYTFEQKLERFLDIALKAYNVPEAMRSDAVERIKSVDIRNYAVRVIRKLAESVGFEHDLSLNGESV